MYPVPPLAGAAVLPMNTTGWTVSALKKTAPKMVNNNWGGTIEDNSFGTHEFLNLCEMLGCEPYISGNVGSGTVEELAKWVEYMTSEGDSPMARLRRQNGRDKAWKVKYLGVGNESWGCGGSSASRILCRPLPPLFHLLPQL